MTQGTATPLGVFETLTEGFFALNKRLWLLLIPILLDILLAFGPGVSLTPSLLDKTSAVFSPALTQLGGTASSGAQTETRDLVSLLSDTNVLGLLAMQLPSLLTASAATHLPPLNGEAWVQIAEPGQLTLSFLALGILSLLLASLYLNGIAGVIRQETFDGVSYVSTALFGWLRYLQLALASFLVIVTVALGGSLLSAIAGVLSQALQGLLSVAFATLSLAALFFLRFADDALFVARARPLQAAWYSFAIIRRHFWSAVGLIALIQVILWGMAIALSLMKGHPTGQLGAIAIYAYIATGLSTGAMLFFWQRLLLLKAQLQEEQPLART